MRSLLRTRRRDRVLCEGAWRGAHVEILREVDATHVEVRDLDGGGRTVFHVNNLVHHGVGVREQYRGGAWHLA